MAPPIKHIPGYPHALRGGSCGQSKAWAHMGQRVREYDLWPSFFTKPSTFRGASRNCLVLLTSRIHSLVYEKAEQVDNHFLAGGCVLEFHWGASDTHLLLVFFFSVGGGHRG